MAFLSHVFCPSFCQGNHFFKNPSKKNSKDILPKIGFLFLQTGPFLNSKVQTRRCFFVRTKTHNLGVIVFKTACSESVGKGASSLSSL